MVLARSKFLNLGIYEPIANTLAKLVFTQMNNYQSANKTICLMDAGCGEGYNFDYIFNVLENKEGACVLSFIGLDISKPAILEAAKRNKKICWIVGANRQPPVEDASVDIVLCVFGFQSFDGFNKTLKPGSKVILVEPGPDHLKELREIIYTKVKKTEPPDLSYAKEIGFSIVGTQTLKFKTGAINNTQINNLLLMTPHFYRATKEGREAAVNLQKLDLTVDIVFIMLEKK